MEITVDNKYQDVAALIRYATIVLTCQSSKNLNAYGQKVISLANQLKFYAYPLNLINTNNSGAIYKVLKNNFAEKNQEKNVLSLNQSDSRFVDSIGVSEIEKNKELILESYTHFYNNGNFDKLNRACYRFLKRIKGVNEYDMNDTVIRYVVSCISLRDFSQCYNIIETLQEEYSYFDYNIYLFFLYLVEGDYDKASKKLLKIKTNISEDFYKYVTEEDLAFYFAFCLLYNFNITDYKEVLSNNDIYVYKLYDKYNKFFEIVDAYYKCDYLRVNNEFNKKLKERINKDPFLSGKSECDYLRVNNEFNKKLKERINKDPFLSGKSETIEKKFKEKILKEILTFSSEISYKTIADLLVISKSQAVDMIVSLIKAKKKDAIIDDIDEVVIMKEPNPMNDLLTKSNELMEKNLDDLIKFSYTNIKHKMAGKIEGKNITKKPLERGYDMRMLEMMGDMGD